MTLVGAVGVQSKPDSRDLARGSGENGPIDLIVESKMPPEPVDANFAEWIRLVDEGMKYNPETAGTQLPLGMHGCLQYRVTATRNNARKLKRRFTLTTEFIVEMYLAQKGLCAISGLPMMPETNQQFSDPFAPSIDRLDNSRGYLRNNVRLVCRIANFAMSVWGECALIELARAIVRKHPS